jgi:DNA-binding winged helix-turn-helix (wHTH) protein/tetratricopeptide (TPR) repeat protein
MMAAAAYRFGPFELRPGEHILTRDGARVPLSPKAFDLLHLLVQRSGSLLEKQELFATVWPDTFVEEANLSVQVAAIRKALQPHCDGAIETVSKRGYRFTAPVEQVSPQPLVADERDVVRLLVLPLQVLAPNLEARFLSRCLPDALASALTAIPWLSVRAPFDLHGPGSPDRTASLANADVALEGSLGELSGQSCLQLRLLRAPSGIVLYAEQTTFSLDTLREVQARVSRQLAQQLAAHFGRDEPRTGETPATPGAYVLYLRANQLAYETSQWAAARELYEAALREDPRYAPAWARLGRCHRVIAKFVAPGPATLESFSCAEAALTRALSLDPDLSIAHNLYAQLEVDLGRPEQAMMRLVRRIGLQPHAPDLFAGLVHVLRYCGLLELSIAAHRRARLLDATVPTSVHHTWWMKGEYEQALGETFGDIGYMPGLALASLGRNRDAIAALKWRERDTTDTRVRCYLVSLRALLEGRRDESLDALHELRGPVDAEARYYVARTYAALGESDVAMVELTRAVEGGFLCHDTFAQDPWLKPLHADARFAPLIASARERSARAAAAFDSTGGTTLLRG